MTSISLKSDKGNLLYIGLSYFGLMIVPTHLLFEKIYTIGIALSLVFTIFVVRWYIAIFRTVLIDKTGITICFYKWQRNLPWNRIAVHMETYRSLGHCGSSSAIVFAEKGRFIQKPRNMQPFLFNLLIQPFSFVYAYIEEDSNFSGPSIYSIGKKEIYELIEKMV